MVCDLKPGRFRTDHNVSHGLAAWITFHRAQRQTEGALRRFVGDILDRGTAHFVEGSRDFRGQPIPVQFLFALNPSEVADLDVCSCSESCASSFSTHRTMAVACKLQRATNLVFDCTTEATATNHRVPLKHPLKPRDYELLCFFGELQPLRLR